MCQWCQRSLRPSICNSILKLDGINHSKAFAALSHTTPCSLLAVYTWQRNREDGSSLNMWLCMTEIHCALLHTLIGMKICFNTWHIPPLTQSTHTKQFLIFLPEWNKKINGYHQINNYIDKENMQAYIISRSNSANVSRVWSHELGFYVGKYHLETRQYRLYTAR